MNNNIIHPSALIYILNPKTSTKEYISINDLFNRYIIYMDNDEFIKFNNISVLGSENNGYTEIISLKKLIHVNCNNWMKISANNNELIISKYTLLPLFDISDKMPFAKNGDIRYNRKVKYVSDIKPHESLSVYNNIDKSEDFVYPKIELLYADSIFGFEIITKSKFMNINNILVKTGI